MPNGKAIKNIEANDVKHEEMKGQIMKECIRRVRNILKSKLNGENIISATNSRAISIVRYGTGIISWTKMELEQLDRKTRELMAMYGAKHPKADVDRLYLEKCEGGRDLIGLEDCMEVEAHSLEKYLEKYLVSLIPRKIEKSLIWKIYSCKSHQIFIFA